MLQMCLLPETSTQAWVQITTVLEGKGGESLEGELKLVPLQQWCLLQRANEVLV